MASSGNSLLSMVQMLAMSMGVAAAGAVLAGFTGYFGGGESTGLVCLPGDVSEHGPHHAGIGCHLLATLTVRVVKKAESTEASGQG